MIVKFYMDNGTVVGVDNLDTGGKDFREWATWLNSRTGKYLVINDTSIDLDKVSWYVEVNQ